MRKPTAEEEGIIRGYAADNGAWGKPPQTVQVQETAPTVGPGARFDMPRTCSVQEGGGCVRIDRARAAQFLRHWRREGIRVKRTRLIGSHGGGFGIGVPGPGWRSPEPK